MVYLMYEQESVQLINTLMLIMNTKLVLVLQTYIKTLLVPN